MAAMSPADVMWSQLIAPTLNAFALTGSLIGVLIGVGLLVGTESTLAFFRRMNRRISTRRALKPLEVQVDVEHGRGNRLLGTAFLLGGGYASVVLLTQLDAAKAASALGFTSNPVTAQVLMETLRWFLIVGGTAAVVFGVMLLVFPRAWSALELRANRWYSTRRMYTSGDDMHLGLDRWVESAPRAAGMLIGVASLVASAAFAVLLFGLP